MRSWREQRWVSGWWPSSWPRLLNICESGANLNDGLGFFRFALLAMGTSFFIVTAIVLTVAWVKWLSAKLGVR